MAAWGVLAENGQRMAGRGAAVPALIQQGSTLEASGWTVKGKRTVVIFLRTSCPFSDEDAAFYREVTVRHGQKSGVGVVVVGAEAPSIVQPWLNDRGVVVDKIIGAPEVTDLYGVGILATPTVVATDKRGVVTDVVVGMMDLRAEAKFHRMLETERSGVINDVVDPPVAGERDLAEKEEWDDSAQRVVDVRERSAYRRGHDKRAINIPADELQVRGPVELRGTERVIVDCRVGEIRMCRDAARRLAMSGVVADVVVLGR